MAPMTSRDIVERLVKCLEGAQAHLLTPNVRSLDWWVKLDAHMSDIIGTWLLLTPALLRATFGKVSTAPAEAPQGQPGEAPKSSQEPPKPPEKGQGSPTALPGPQRGDKAPESTPKKAPPKPVGRFDQGDGDGMGFKDPEGLSCEPACPKCGSRMTDDRLTKKNKKAPDFKCASGKRPACKGAWWPNEFQSRWEEANHGKPAPDHYQWDGLADSNWRFVHVLTSDEETAIHVNPR